MELFQFVCENSHWQSLSQNVDKFWTKVAKGTIDQIYKMSAKYGGKIWWIFCQMLTIIADVLHFSWIPFSFVMLRTTSGSGPSGTKRQFSYRQETLRVIYIDTYCIFCTSVCYRFSNSMFSFLFLYSLNQNGWNRISRLVAPRQTVILTILVLVANRGHSSGEEDIPNLFSISLRTWSTEFWKCSELLEVLAFFPGFIGIMFSFSHFSFFEARLRGLKQPKY